MNSLKLKVLALVLVIIAIGLYKYPFLEDKSYPMQDHHMPTLSSKNEPETVTFEEIQLQSKVVGNSEKVLHDEYVVSDVKKPLESDWCVAQDELAESDFKYVLELEQDWFQFKGRAEAKLTNESLSHEDSFYPGNEFVSAYQELPIESLEKQAFAGDKWAMITYLQKSGFRQRDKAKEIAEKLLVSGASYHAISFLIVNELARAKTSYRKTQNAKLAAEHLSRAISYTLFGLREYDDSALSAYFGVITEHPFNDILNPAIVLKNKREYVITQYQALTDMIEQQRRAQSIDVKQPPEAVKRRFKQSLALIQYDDKQAAETLSYFDIDDSANLNRDRCTQHYFARTAKIRKQQARADY